MTQLAVITVMAAHLACMHLASAGPLVCAGLAWRHWLRRDEAARDAGLWLGRASLLAAVAGIGLGLAAGWMFAHEHRRAYGPALASLQHKIRWGLLELGIYCICLAAFVLWWKRRPPEGFAAAAVHSCLPAVAGLNLLYHFPPLFSLLGRMARGQIPTSEMLDAAAFRQALFHTDILAKTVHFWGASFAVAGVFLMAFAPERLGSGPSAGQQAPAVRWGGWLALAATALQFPVGIWTLAQTPAEAKYSILGPDLAGLSMLLASLVVAVILLHQLTVLLASAPAPATVRRCVALLMLLVWLMTGTLQRINHALRPVASIPQTACMDR